MKVLELTQGTSPLIFSSPHTGTFVPEAIKACFTPAALKLPDTDWHVNRLYENFAREQDATFLKANYSRYVVDLNRPPDDTALYPGQAKVPLCPDQTFFGDDIYLVGKAPNAQEIAARLQQYWQPYHDELAKQIKRVHALHGYAILYDCHSIYSNIPRLFEGRLPDLNLGTANGQSSSAAVEQAAYKTAQQSPYSAVLNGRFIGGYITRHYGRPEAGVHAIQMEIVRDTHICEKNHTYEESKAEPLRVVLERILQAIIDNAAAYNTRAGVETKPIS